MITTNKNLDKTIIEQLQSAQDGKSLRAFARELGVSHVYLLNLYQGETGVGFLVNSGALDRVLPHLARWIHEKAAEYRVTDTDSPASPVG